MHRASEDLRTCLCERHITCIARCVHGGRPRSQRNSTTKRRQLVFRKWWCCGSEVDREIRDRRVIRHKGQERCRIEATRQACDSSQRTGTLSDANRSATATPFFTLSIIRSRHTLLQQYVGNEAAATRWIAVPNLKHVLTFASVRSICDPLPHRIKNASDANRHLTVDFD